MSVKFWDVVAIPFGKRDAIRDMPNRVIGFHPGELLGCR
jgi:hypothetical protein